MNDNSDTSGWYPDDGWTNDTSPPVRRFLSISAFAPLDAFSADESLIRLDAGLNFENESEFTVYHLAETGYVQVLDI